MNQVEAFKETIELAERLGMPAFSSLHGWANTARHAIGLEHLKDMFNRLTPDMSPAKMGRWLGWAQACVVAAGVGATLEDMKAINQRWADETYDRDPVDELILSLEGKHDCEGYPDDECKQAAKELRDMKLRLQAAVALCERAVRRTEAVQPEPLAEAIAEKLMGWGVGAFADGLLTEAEAMQLKSRLKQTLLDVIKEAGR